MSERKPGYYWVQYDGWQVAEWAGGCYWYLTGCETGICDSELVNIEERRIERPADPERVFYDHKPKGAE